MNGHGKHSSKGGTGNKRGKKIALTLGIFLVVILVMSAIAPCILNQVNNYMNAGKWNSGDTSDITPRNLTDAGPGDIGGGYINPLMPDNPGVSDPNYDVNITADETFTIQSCSDIDYKSTIPLNWISQEEKTKFGESYISGDHSIRIIVTNLNGTAIPDVDLIVSCYAHDTAPPFINFFIQDTITLAEDEIITCSQGDNSNEYKFDMSWGGIPRELGWYSNQEMSIKLTDDDLLHYSDFAITDINIQWSSSFKTPFGNSYEPNIYVRLGSDTQQLLGIQQGMFTDADYQGMRIADNFTSQGSWDGDFNCNPSPDIFRGLNTANVSGDFWKPSISTYDNDVYKFHETRLICVDDMTGLTEFGFYYVMYNGTTVINPESYWLRVAIYDLNNESADITIPASSNHYYIITIDGVVSTELREYTFLLLATYMYGSQQYMERLGKTLCEFSHADFITAFEYTYNFYFIDEQQIHRIIYDTNNKAPLVVDFNSPFYLNETTAEFKIRYMLGMPGVPLGTNSPDAFAFDIVMEIYDNDGVYITVSDGVAVGYGAVGSKAWDIDLAGTGLKDLTSYGMRITISSMETTSPYGTTRYSQIYSECLYYVLRNYLEFRDDIHDMSDLIKGLKTKDDVGESTYSEIETIISVMKTKIQTLETDFNSLRQQYPGICTTQSQAVEDAIQGFKDEYVALKTFMEDNKWEDIQGSNSLFLTLREGLTLTQWRYGQSFTVYNFYIAALNGESGIADDGAKLIAGIDEKMEQRERAYLNAINSKFLPWIVLALTLLVSAIIAAIIYYVIKPRIKSRVALLILVLISFGFSAVIIYMILMSMSTAILYWIYWG